MIRVLSRLRAMRGDPKHRRLVEECWFALCCCLWLVFSSVLYDAPCYRRALAGSAVDPERPGDFNQAMMELGATLCTQQVLRDRNVF